MSSKLLNADLTRTQRVECGHCRERLPLRLSQSGERGAVWLCAECGVPFISVCIKDRLIADGTVVRLDERYFDTTGLPSISPKIRREVAKLAQREEAPNDSNLRRSDRISQSLVVPAVKLDANMTPVGNAFEIMVANISREGIGLVFNDSIDSEYLALELPHGNNEPIQVVTRLVRQRELELPLREFGGEFYVRLGSTVTSS